MKKALKVGLYVFLGIVVFAIIMASVATLGLKEAENLDIAAIDLNQVEDGEYQGDYVNGRWTNNVVVTVKDHQITNIDYTRAGNEAQAKQAIEEILKQQKVDIDAVSGATASTNSFLKAVEDALE